MIELWLQWRDLDAAPRGTSSTTSQWALHLRFADPKCSNRNAGNKGPIPYKLDTRYGPTDSPDRNALANSHARTLKPQPQPFPSPKPNSISPHEFLFTTTTTSSHHTPPDLSRFASTQPSWNQLLRTRLSQRRTELLKTPSPDSAAEALTGNFGPTHQWLTVRE